MFGLIPQREFSVKRLSAVALICQSVHTGVGRPLFELRDLEGVPLSFQSPASLALQAVRISLE